MLTVLGINTNRRALEKSPWKWMPICALRGAEFFPRESPQSQLFPPLPVVPRTTQPASGLKSKCWMKKTDGDLSPPTGWGKKSKGMYSKIFHGSQLLNLRRARKRRGIIKPEKTLETAGSTLQSLSSSQNVNYLGLMPSLSSVFLPILGRITAIIHWGLTMGTRGHNLYYLI